MNTAANLLVILIFLAAFYTFLGLLCGIAEKASGLVIRPRPRRRMRRSSRRRIPRRGMTAATDGSLRAGSLLAQTQEKPASRRRPAPSAAAAGEPRGFSMPIR